ncbi:MAG: hypothetical protein ABFD14_03910 [Anaerolineaceae bacterium]
MKFKMNLFVFILGMVLMAIGLYLIYPPAAFISVGVILMGISLFGREKSE